MRPTLRRSLSVWLAVAVLAAGPLAADELDDRAQAFREAARIQLERLRESAAKAAPAPQPYAVQQAEMIEQELAQLGSAISSEPESTLGRLNQLRDLAGLSSELKALIGKLAEDLPKLTEQRTERQLAEVDRLIKAAAAACLTAEAESELDPSLRALGRAAQSRQRGAFSNERGQRAARRLQGAMRTVSTWQDYLAQLALGNEASAKTALKRLLEADDFPILARAEIEKRLAPPGAGADAATDAQLEVLRRVRSIEDLEAALANMPRLPAADDTNLETGRLRSFEQLAAVMAAARTGFIGEAFRVAVNREFNFSGNLSLEWNAELSRLRGLLLLYLLPRYLDVPDSSSPRAAETGADYLLRLIDELIKQRRFAESMRTLETYRTVAFGAASPAPAWLADDLKGLGFIATADRFVAATSWVEAIKSFRNAAAINGKFTPSAEAARRVTELSLAHPEEAKAAAHLAKVEAISQRLSREITDAAARAVDTRIPPEMRARMRQPGFP